jgi:hypothetical protein
MSLRSAFLTVGLWACAACGGDDAAVDAGPRPPDANTTGTFSFRWSITDGSRALRCDDVDAASVSIQMIPDGGATGTADAFSCGQGSATTKRVPARTYDVELSIRSGAGRLGPSIRVDNAIVTAGGDTDLGAIEFEVVPRGSLSFQIETGDPAGNCAGGAELESVALRLVRDASCVPARFDLDGAGQLDDDCVGDAPATAACVDAGTVIILSETTSGPHGLSIAGRVAGGVPCYVKTAQVRVPGGNLTTVLGAIAVPIDSANPSCNPGAIDAGAAGTSPGDR